MTEQRCTTCRFWQHPAESKWTGAPPMSDGPVMADWGWCRLLSCDVVTRAPLRAQVLGEYCSDMILVTAPDFSCVQHEPKDNQ